MLGQIDIRWIEVHAEMEQKRHAIDATAKIPSEQWQPFWVRLSDMHLKGAQVPFSTTRHLKPASQRDAWSQVATHV